MVLTDWSGTSIVSVTTPPASCSQTIMFVSGMGTTLPSEITGARGWSDSFDHGGDPHAAADAQADHGATGRTTFQFVHDGADQHRPGGAQWMPHGDRATVDVDLFPRQLKILDVPQHHRGERLVDLE